MLLLIQRGLPFAICLSMVVSPIGYTAAHAALWDNSGRQGPRAPQITPVPIASAGKVKTAALSQTDKYMLKQAADACKFRDFKQFFTAALRSREVRLRYFKSPISTPRGKYAPGSYNFPIQMIDYSFTTANAAHSNAFHREFVSLQFNYAQDERVRVDWVRIDYGKNGNDEGETPEDDREYGRREYLLFVPTAGCWTLAQEGREN